MKAVFVASHSQSKDLESFYKRILVVLEEMGCSVFTGSLFEKNKKEELLKDQKVREVWYKTSIKKIREADVVIVEASYPSTANVGHELTYALDLGKPVIVLYLTGRDPMFLKGRVDDKLAIIPYTDDDLEQVLKNALDYAISVQDTRFNFFISPEIGAYLDWISKNKRIPRAVYLRRLIEEDMKSNKEYNGED